jgi:hypothetical protein
LADAVVADAVIADAVMADAVIADAVVTDAVIAHAVIADAVIANAVIADAVIADAVIADAVIADAVMADAVIADAVVADALGWASPTHSVATAVLAPPRRSGHRRRRSLRPSSDTTSANQCSARETHSPGPRAQCPSRCARAPRPSGGVLRTSYGAALAAAAVAAGAV